MTASPERLPTGLAVADRLLQIWAERAPEVAQSRDRNDQMLWIGLARVFRCLRSIRDLVRADQEADDALILARAMMSTAMRSLWLATPDDGAERIRRGRIFTRYSFLEARKQARELEELEMETGISADEWLQMAEEVEVEGDMPSDVNLATELAFGPVYSTIYRTGSGSVHWSLLAALEGFDQASVPPGELESLSGIKIRMHEGQPERAGTALLQACVVATMFLEQSDAVVRHGMGDIARAVLVDAVPDASESPPE